MAAVVNINATVTRIITVPHGQVVTLLNDDLTDLTSQKWEALPPRYKGKFPDFGTNWSAWTYNPTTKRVELTQTGSYPGVTFKPDRPGTYTGRLTATTSGGTTKQTFVIRVLPPYSDGAPPGAAENTEEDAAYGWSLNRNDDIINASERKGWVRVYNGTGGEIAANKVCKISGTVDWRTVAGNADPGGSATEEELVFSVSVGDASSANADHGSYVVLPEAIPGDSFGWGISHGKHDLDLTGFTAGAPVYLNDSGDVSATPGTAEVTLGVTVVSGANGSIDFSGLPGRGGGGDVSGSGTVDQVAFWTAAGDVSGSDAFKYFNTGVEKRVALDSQPTKASASGAYWDAFSLDGTLNFTGNTGVTEIALARLKAPTIAGDTAGLVVTDAGTLVIDGPPAAGANVSITNPWALWAKAGDVRFDNAVYAGNGLAIGATPYTAHPVLSAGDGDGAPVSQADEAAIRYNNATGTWETSINAGSWGPLASVGGSGAVNQIAFWSDPNTLSGTDSFLWRDGVAQQRLEITASPTKTASAGAFWDVVGVLSTLNLEGTTTVNEADMVHIKQGTINGDTPTVTVTDVAGLRVHAPAAGTNVSIQRAYSVWATGDGLLEGDFEVTSIAEANRFRANSGNEANPSYGFQASTGSGLWRVSSTEVGMSAAGSEVMRWGSGLNVIVSAGTIADAATDGFLHLSMTTSGAPTGTPTQGDGAVVVGANDIFYFRSGGAWHALDPSAGGGTIDGSGAATRLAIWSDSDTLTSHASVTSSGGAVNAASFVASSTITATGNVQGARFLAGDGGPTAVSYGFSGTDGDDDGFYRPSDNTMYWQANGTTVFAVNQNDVGVYETNPAARFHITENVNNAEILRLEGVQSDATVTSDKYALMGFYNGTNRSFYIQWGQIDLGEGDVYEVNFTLDQGDQFFFNGGVFLNGSVVFGGQVISDINPAVDDTFSIGDSGGNVWADVRATLINGADFHMGMEHSDGDWWLREGKDGIYAFDANAKKAYRLAMEEVDVRNFPAWGPRKKMVRQRIPDPKSRRGFKLSKEKSPREWPAEMPEEIRI